MPMYNVPRCQHLKVNGTQCGSPALKRNRFCFFHKRFQEERIKLSCDRVRHNRASLYLPVLEDANSIQVSLMQIMRLLASRQIDSKTASLLLYALQTASVNLRQISFEPNHLQDVVIDRRTIDQTCIRGDQWSEDDFPDPEETEEEKAEAAAEQAAEAAAKAQAAAKERARQKAAAEAEANRLIRQGDPTYVDDPPPGEKVRVGTGTLARSVERSSTGSATKPSPIPLLTTLQPPPLPAVNKQPAPSQNKSHTPTAAPKPTQKKTPQKVDLNKVREKIQGMARDWIMKTAKEGNHSTPRTGGRSATEV
jgi:protein-tyrosine-phosphatase